MLNFIANIFSSRNDRILKRMKSYVDSSNKLEEGLSKLTRW